MVLKDSGPFDPPRFPAWQREYDAVLSETDSRAVFKCLEAAEVAIHTRRAALDGDADHKAERRAIEEALVRLGEIKRNRLLFL